MEKQIRLVAVILPETNSWGEPIAEGQTMRLARQDETGHPWYCLVLKEIGPRRGHQEGNKPVIYSKTVFFPDHGTIEQWEAIRNMLDLVLMLPPLHAEDFDSKYIL